MKIGRRFGQNPSADPAKVSLAFGASHFVASVDFGDVGFAPGASLAVLLQIRLALLFFEHSSQHGFAVALLEQFAAGGVGLGVLIANLLEFGRLQFAGSDAVIRHLAEKAEGESAKGKGGEGKVSELSDNDVGNVLLSVRCQ